MENRPIKYRVWDTKKQRTGFAMRISFSDGGTILGVDADFGGKESDMLIKNFILMQWTGYANKNGIDLYEGDIIYINKEDHRAIIKWGDGGLYLSSIDSEKWCDDWNLCDDCGRMIVLGNIHANPELEYSY